MGMEILYVTSSFPSPSVQIWDARFLLAEVSAYSINGAKVTVLTPFLPGCPELELLNSNAKVIRFHYIWPRRYETLKRPNHPIYELKGISSLIKLAFLLASFLWNILKYGKHNDLIHCQWTPTALLSLPLKLLLKKKIVVTIRGSDTRLIPPLVNRFILRHVDAVVDCFGEQPWVSDIKTKFTAKYIKLPLIVDIDNDDKCQNIRLFKDEDDRHLKVLYCGRLVNLKIQLNNLPIYELIDACKELIDNGIPIKLAYLGDGEPEVISTLQKKIAENHLEDHIVMLGGRFNVAGYIKWCHLGVGGIAHNAVSQEFTILGKPQILINGTDNKSTLWSHLRNCIMVEPNNPRDLAMKLTWAYHNKEQLPKIGEHAKSDLKHLIVDTKTGGKVYLEAFKGL